MILVAAEIANYLQNGCWKKQHYFFRSFELISRNTHSEKKPYRNRAIVLHEQVLSHSVRVLQSIQSLVRKGTLVVTRRGISTSSNFTA
jgi:hypothetical protein